MCFSRKALFCKNNPKCILLVIYKIATETAIGSPKLLSESTSPTKKKKNNDNNNNNKKKNSKKHL